ncbi:MAG: hypothetical protein ABW178_00635 [Pseudoxanthomonas sp.]
MTAGSTGAQEPDVGDVMGQVATTRAATRWRRRPSRFIGNMFARASVPIAPDDIVIVGEAGMRENPPRPMLLAERPAGSPHSDKRAGVAACTVVAIALTWLRTGDWRRPRVAPRRGVMAWPNHVDEQFLFPPDSTAPKTIRRRFTATRTAVAVEESIA